MSAVDKHIRVTSRNATKPAREEHAQCNVTKMGRVSKTEMDCMNASMTSCMAQTGVQMAQMAAKGDMKMEHKGGR